VRRRCPSAGLPDRPRLSVADTLARGSEPPDIWEGPLVIGVNEDAATATGATPDAKERAVGASPHTLPSVAPIDADRGRILDEKSNGTVAQPDSRISESAAPTDHTEPSALAAPAGAPARRRPDAGDLVQRAGAAFQEYREGVPGAIDRLVRLVSPLLWHTARQCGLTAAESEDAVQQTFLLLVRNKDTISDPLAVVRWMTVSLRRLAWRERSASAKRSGEEPTDEDLPRAPSAEHAAVLTDQQRRLWAQVSELSERCRRLLAVIAFAPRPDYASIAADLGIPVGSIGPTRGRCLAKLRARLDGGDWS
jgi:RNA polymerase sigma factor (sigma-70 family)